jgi:hypothetical protein
MLTIYFILSWNFDIFSDGDGDFGDGMVSSSIVFFIMVDILSLLL